MRHTLIAVITASWLYGCVATDTPSSSSSALHSSSSQATTSAAASSEQHSSSSAASSSLSAATSSSAPAQSSQYCPADTPCRILPLGDSITVGVPENNGGYRAPLFRLAVAANLEITFVGQNPPDQGGFSAGSNGPNGPATIEGVAFAPYHLGTSGITIEDLQQKIMDFNLLPFAAPNNLEPHIVLLHIGTNNMWNGGPNGTDEKLRAMVDYLTAVLPDALIVVSNIIPWPAQASNVNQYNSYIRPIVEAKQAAGYNVIFVDQFSQFPSNQLADGIHPNATGYAAMAEVWFEAIDEYLVDID